MGNPILGLVTNDQASFAEDKIRKNKMTLITIGTFVLDAARLEHCTGQWPGGKCVTMTYIQTNNHLLPTTGLNHVVLFSISSVLYGPYLVASDLYQFH